MISQNIKAIVSPVRIDMSGNDIVSEIKTFTSDGTSTDAVELKLANKDNKALVNPTTNIVGTNGAIFEFRDEKQVSSLIEKLHEVEKILKEAKKSSIKFLVPIKNLIVSKQFAVSNPSSKKLLESMKYYEKTGKLDREIVVSSTLTIEDGYIGYLVAKYFDKDFVEVTAPEGISILLGKSSSSNMVFTSDKIDIRIRELGGNNKAATFVNGANKVMIHFMSMYELLNIMNKINSVFVAEFKVHATHDFAKEIFTQNILRETIQSYKIKATFYDDLVS